MDALIMYVVGTIMHTLPYYANCIFSISYICISFLHATGLSILCIVSLCTILQTARSWEDLGRHYQGKYCYSCTLFLCSLSKHPALASDGRELWFNTDGLFCVLYDSAITLAQLLYAIDPIKQ